MKTLIKHKSIIEFVYITLFMIFGGYANAQYGGGPPPPPQSQNFLPTGYVELGFGLTQPVGNFASNTSMGYGNYALPGDNVSISLGIPIEHTNFGVALMYAYSNNPFDIDTYVENIQFSDQSNNYAPLIQDSYRENLFMGGLFVTVPVQRFSFDLRAMGGLAVCSMPEVAYEAEATSLTATNNFTWDTYSSISTSFAYDIGAGLRYRFRIVCLMAGIDFMGTNPVVSTTQQYTDQNGNNSYMHIGGSIPISMLTYSIGFGYEFR